MSEMPEVAAAAKEPIFKAPGVVLILIGVFVAIHLVLQWAGEDWRVWSLYAFAFIPARISGGEPFPAIYGSQVWSFLTYAFLHGSWSHLFSNCIWFLVFGTVVARRLGTARFLVLCAITAICGAAALLITHWGDGGNVIGASGAVSGLMAAATPLMFGKRILMFDPDGRREIGIVALKPFEILSSRGAVVFLVVFFVATLYSGATGWTGTSYIENGTIAWEAHLGGFAAGLIAFYLLDHGIDLPSAQS
jgi:membrane associated rhomboid family serine protease